MPQLKKPPKPPGTALDKQQSAKWWDFLPSDPMTTSDGCTFEPWLSPLRLRLRASGDADSYKSMGPFETALPVLPHPGAFGAVRTHHVHEGVDLYCPPGTLVYAVEAGEVVAVAPFTGELAGLPWWLDTAVVLVEGPSGVVAYGEIEPQVTVGTHVPAGAAVGQVLRVLKHDKGRPTSMLHLELHAPGTRICPEWKHPDARPATLLDPTRYLLSCTPSASQP